MEVLLRRSMYRIMGTLLPLSLPSHVAPQWGADIVQQASNALSQGVVNDIFPGWWVMQGWVCSLSM